MIHSFKDSIEIAPPTLFTYPFYYTPHPLCVIACKEVQSYLSNRTDWHAEINEGKMFGVLVIRNEQQELGYIAAFSGNLAGSNNHSYFVPPVYDLLNPDGYFKEEESAITELNHQICQLECNSTYQELRQSLQATKEKAESELSEMKQAAKKAKTERDMLRQSHLLSEMELEKLNKESQIEKIQVKKRKQYWEEQIKQAESEVQRWETQIKLLKDERKTRSFHLQQWIFQQFRLHNAQGETMDLCEIFANTNQQIPPAGAGECAAPKLLQYAYTHRLQPLAMAEFWWGNSPKGEIRHHGNYYPACKHKCEPILNFMLQGLNVEPNPLMTPNKDINSLETVYEDPYIVIVNKPAGMLSVPGKNGDISVYSILRAKYPEATGPLLVHRLDMDTSGLLLAAKDKTTHELLQAQFESRSIKKRYIAILDGPFNGQEKKGFIRLPLCPDYNNRPIQLVDYENGKVAITRYEILETDLSHTRIAYYPETGRTHQLRVHSAHPNGMNLPIKGDTLYGQPSDRLYLHAEKIEFKHPIGNRLLCISKEAPF